MDPLLQARLEGIKQAKDATFELPDFKGTLEPYQRVGVSFLVLARKALLLDFVGAGKTVQSIAADVKLRALGSVRRTLVVCQGGKRRDWKEEYQRFTDLPVYVIEGPKQQRVQAWLEACSDAGVAVVNYESVRGDLLERKEEQKGKRKRMFYVPSSLLDYVKADLVIFDEVSIFKNWGTVLAQSLECLIGKVNPVACFGLSATPIQKTLEDLHSIMEVVSPGLLGPRWQFEANYCIKRDITVFPRGRPVTITKVVGYRNEPVLGQIMSPHFIRREKKEVFGDKQRHVFKLRRVDLTAEQRKQYQLIQAGVSQDEGGMNLLQRFGQLEKTCDTMSFFGDSHTSAKLDDLKFLLTNELVDEKVVIFSKYKRTLAEVESQILVPEGIKYIRYTGDEDINDRENDRRRFLNEPDIRVALVTSAAEMGLNFHAAHYMVFLNHIYNPARIEQMIGRIDRPLLQQSPFTCSIHYVAADTFEEDLVPRLYKEADLLAKVFGATNFMTGLSAAQSSYDITSRMSASQLYDLIKTGHLNVKVA